MPRGVPNNQANGHRITQVEAMKQALAALGRDAMPTEIRKWIRKNLKLTLHPNNISAYKTYLNRKASEQSTTASPQKPEISMMEAIRRALTKLGAEAKPQDIQPFIKSKFGIEMEPTLISNYKSSILKKSARQSAVIRSLSTPLAPASTLAAAPGDADGFSLDEIQAVKAVVEKVGAEKVQQLAKVLAK